jgi:hypothetical protein
MIEPATAFPHRRTHSVKEDGMDGERFDAWAKALLVGRASRRGALRLLVEGGAGTALLISMETSGIPRGALAQIDCRPVGQSCRRGRRCCSGRCSRRRGRKRKRCRAVPGQGTCTIRDNVCAGVEVGCNGDPTCACYVTTAGTSFCAEDGTACQEGGICTTNAICEAVLGPGSVCVRPPACCGGRFGQTACVRPCPTAG